MTATQLLARLGAAALLCVSSVPSAHAVETMPLADIRPGMEGVCVTEMDGGERVEFPVTILGTTGASAPERELVLVRLDDERFRETGIIAGMSGSPVYVDGRLVGAVAYGWAFSTRPIAGVTPFERMSGLRSDDASPPTASSITAALGQRPSAAEIAAAVRDGDLGDLVLEWLLPETSGSFDRLPLVVGAPALDEAGGWLAEGFRRLGWLGAPAGAGGSDETSGGPLRPGGMTAAVLVDGDAAVAIGGTVTEVRGDDVWAFGHVMLGAGNLELPMARASVLAVLPSQLQSFKFFRTGEIVGAFRADRQHGVWGRLGATAAMVPVTVDVDDRTFRFRSARHDVLTPLLVAYLTQSSYAAHGRTFGGQTVGLEIDVELEDGRDTTLEQWFVGSDAAARAAAYSSAVVAFVTSSGFERPAPAAVRVRLTTSESLDSAEVVDAVPDRWTVAPGDEIEVRVRVRPRRGPDRIERLRVTVPARVPDGRLDLVVADGASWSAYDLRMRPARPASFGDELELLDRLEPSSRLVAALERPEPGVQVGSAPLPAPAGVLLQLKAALGPNLETTSWGVVARSDRDVGGPVAGGLRIPLRVDAAATRR